MAIFALMVPRAFAEASCLLSPQIQAWEKRGAAGIWVLETILHGALNFFLTGSVRCLGIQATKIIIELKIVFSRIKIWRHHASYEV